MASSITRLPNKTSMNHITFPQNFHPKTHPIGQVSLPNNNHLSPSLKSSIVASNSALLEITLPTTTNNHNNIYTNTISTSITPKHTQKNIHKISTTSTSSSTTTTKHLANIWREIQGCNNWENLLNPLHPILREEIIRYGEFVTSSYKAFDLDTNSKRYLNCKYGKKNMLKEVGMENCGYEVTKYIYATPPNIIENNSSGRWIGYVAVSSDDSYKKLGRRDIVVTFRGTVTNQEWISNLMSSLTPASLDPNNQLPNVKVESGFLSLYTSDESSSKFGLQSCREQLLSEVSRLMKKHKGEKNVSISLAGHSMGSALAILLAYDISELGLHKKNDKNDASVTVFSFGGPRVGNLEFKKRCEELGVKVLRISNVNDPITKLPGVVFNENFRVLMGGRYEFPWSCSCYAHVGVELMLDFFNMQNPSCVHDLDTYIGLLRCPKKKIEEVIHSQSDGVGVNFLLEKARMFLLKSSISQVFAAGGGNHHDFLCSVSTDILCSWSDELLFGLVLLLL